jgi:hypothetical protein
MPIPLARDMTALHDNLELGRVSDNCNIAVQAYGDRFRFPVQVADLPGADAAQILLLRESPAQRVDELKVLRVQLSRSFNIATH